jgi:hypothetical protein
MCTWLVLRVPRQYTSTQTGLLDDLLGQCAHQAEMADESTLGAPDCRPTSVTTVRTRGKLTRGEPRPVHITLIATCRVHFGFYNPRSGNSGELLLGSKIISPQATRPHGG